MTTDVAGAELVVVPDPEALAEQAADRIRHAIGGAVQARGVAHLALTGGSTAAGVFRALAAPPLRDAVPWRHVHLWWGDERFVPRHDPLSNVRTADQFLLSGPDGRPGIPIPAGQVHPVPCDEALAAGRDADACAADYARELRALLPVDDAGWPVFDLVLAGIGSDGHVLSVFPGSAAFGRREWAVGVPAPDHIEPHVARVTLNPAVIGAARAVLTMAQGTGKAAILAAIFGPQRDPLRWPAQLALRSGATWILDRAAAGELTGILAPDDPGGRR